MLFILSISAVLASDFPSVCCCGSIVIVGIIGIIAAFTRKEDLQNGTGGSEVPVSGRPLLSNTVFQTYVHEEMKDFGELALPVFTVEMQGPVPAPVNNCPVIKTITLFDITKGEEDQQPVLCSLDNLQYQDTVAFFSASPDVLPYTMSLLQNWQPLLSVPIETLTFPARGRRRLRFTVVISAAGSNSILARGTFDLLYMNEKPGYVDSQKSRLRAAELAVKLAVSVSAVDGSFAGTEGRVVKNWIQKRIASTPANKQEDVKKKLNDAVESAMFAAGKCDPGDILHLCRELIDMHPIPADSMGDKYDVLELCLNVASADGTAKGVEMDLVHALADMMGVDKERFRTMTEKILPVDIMETEDTAKLLGLDPSWSREKKRKHLRSENRKWRALATHKDKKKQEQARKMQELIAQEMAKLEKDGKEG